MSDGTILGRVLRAFGNRFDVQVNREVVSCSFRGRLRRDEPLQSSVAVVGDEVVVSIISHGSGIIEQVLPRRTQLSRRAAGPVPMEQVIAANLDQMVVIFATRSPRLKLRMLDRFLVAAGNGGLDAIICINKTDLVNLGKLERKVAIYAKLGYRVILTSAVTRHGLDRFREVLRDKASVLGGPSGVGKSSLLNAIQPGLSIRTQDISESRDKGRHTTSSIELHPLDFGGYVADTPGIRELGLWNVSQADLAGFFPEMKGLLGGCKFTDCSHTHEPGCAVKAAVCEGKITEERYESYVRILNTL